MNNLDELFSIGSDESGKGDFFGAPSVAAVKLDPSSLSKLKEQKILHLIRDSKQMDDDTIRQIAPTIMEICQNHHVSLNPTEFNQRFRECKNTNIILSQLHNEVHSKINGDEPRIIDAFATEENYSAYLFSQGISQVKIDMFVQKADSKYLSVALASILARYHYIKQMDNLSLKSGVRLPYGNSYHHPNSVIKAYKDLLSKGFTQEEIDSGFVKENFSTLKKIKSLI